MLDGIAGFTQTFGDVIGGVDVVLHHQDATAHDVSLKA
jgi:hypothetical protein